jgi:transposase
MTYGTTSLVADSALSREANLHKLAQLGSSWLTRVPATLTEARTALAQATPEAVRPLMAGYRDRVLASTYGGVAQRRVRLYSEHRRPQAQHTVDTRLRKQGTADIKAFQKLGRTAVACEADAPQALSAFGQTLQATHGQQVTIRPRPRYAKRGRPSPAGAPARLGSQIDGALASSGAAREALVVQHRCFLLATNELNESALSPRELLEGYPGQKHVERGFRLLKDPLWLASSLYLNKPQRIMALLMIMTACWPVYAALEYRLRKGLKAQQATLPNHKGPPIQHPTARGVFQDFVGIHWLLSPGEGPLVLHLSGTHDHRLRRLGHPYKAFDSSK